MRDFDAGHKETQTKLPEPLSGTGAFSVLGTWALPAKTLSVASVLVFVVVAVFLLHDSRFRALFVMPYPVAVGLAAGAALLAWIVAVLCRARPGRHFPRFWTLALAGAALLIAAGCAFDPSPTGTPWLHALAVAAFAAAVAMVPRIFKLRVDSRMVQRIAPLTIALVLVLILPSACYVGNTVIAAHEQRIGRHILELKRSTATIREATGYDWSQLQDSPDAAAANVARLSGLRFDGLLADPGMWRAAVVLKRETELAEVSHGLLDAVVEGLDPQRTPKLSLLSEPAVRWDMAAKRWIPSSRFPRSSAITSDYHREMGRLFLELEQGEAVAEIPPMIELETYSRRKRAELKGYLTGTLDTWADNWVVFQMPVYPRWVDRDRLPLVDLLGKSLVKDAETRLPPADLRQWIHLQLAQIRRLAAHAPGCETATYREGDYEYFRLDCYAYAPRSEGAGAELRVEMRVVYQSERWTPLGGEEKPAEIYFLFPVPEATSSQEFAEEVMTELAAAVRDFWDGSFSTTDRSGSVTAGFRLVKNDEQILVYRPRPMDLHDERRAIEVRAEMAGIH